MKGTGVNPIGSSLFGQQNTLGQQQQGGLFGKPAGGFFSATTSAPTFPSATTASSLFGGQPQTGGLFGAAKPAGSSLFGAATSQPSGGLFGQQQQQPSSAFGSTTAGGAGLFGQNKPSAFGQVSQPSIFGGQPTTGGMFGGTAPSSVGGFGTATTTTTGLFGGQPQQSAFSFGQQPQQAAGSTNLFGAKPSQPFGFGTPPTQSGALFGAPLSKIGTGSIFGAQQQQPATGGLFGQAPATNLLQKPAQPSMFGTTTPQNMAGAGMFGTGFSQPTGFGGAAAAGSPPIILGSNVNISGIQQAIISAQLSSLPYGDSPLLKSPAVSPSSKALDDIASLQRQLHLSNRRLDGPSMFGSPKSDKSLATTQLDTTKSSATDLNGSFLEQSFTYKPLVLLPSVGFGAALGLHQSPKLKSKGDSLLKSMQSEDEKNVKSLDISVVYETVQQSRSNDADESNLSNEIPSEPSRIEFIRTPEKSIRSDISTASAQTNAQSPLPETSPQPHETSKEYRVKLTRPEYYCKPSVKELEELYHVDGTCQIESGLTVGRVGYGSVFWKGPIQLDGPVDLDEVVHFRNKEVVVYPDETTKPDVGTGLNRFAEVSLDRVWPVDPKTKQPIKDVDELRRFGFREKLERLCQRLDAVFRDYQPATGTWQFDVQHFSKYGFEDDENHQKASHNNGTAKRPIGFCDDVDSSEETENRLDFSVFDQEDSKLFQNGEVLQKKLKLDDTLFESKKLLSHVAKEAKKRARLIERLPKNAFKTVSGGGAAVFQKSGLVFDHRSCRVGFSNGHILTALNGHLSAVSVLSLEVVPTIKDILTIYKQKKSRIDLQLNALPSISGGLISFDPPSMLLRLLDTHVRNSFRTGESEGAQVVETILTLCDIVCVKVDSLEAKVSQRVQMGVWLKDRLSNRPPRRAQEPPSVFDGVFHHLVCGSHKKAVDAARHSRHYNLALLLSMFKCPTSKLIRDQVGKQLAVTDKKQTTAIGYANILELLSGGWSSRRKGCLEGLDWLQILGVLIWYHSSPWTTLSDAVNQLETLVEVDG
ncbi:Nuclear pore complex protein Nup98-Nup96, variant 2 [Globodera pallida]|nr:Nuclear pore complex protein Nup98-Nup96, variant 2 [Globodera pallida]